jgi:hypothetical protein
MSHRTVELTSPVSHGDILGLEMNSISDGRAARPRIAFAALRQASLATSAEY